MEVIRADLESCPNAGFYCFISTAGLLVSFVAVQCVFLEPGKFSGKKSLRWNSDSLPGKIGVLLFDIKKL